MYCNNCGNFNPDGTQICGFCNMSMSAQPSQNIIVVEDNNKREDGAARTGQYLAWMIVPYIPVIGWIFFIIYAIDGSNRTRANFFRAQIVAFLIVVFSIWLIFVIAGWSIEQLIGDLF